MCHEIQSIKIHDPWKTFMAMKILKNMKSDFMGHEISMKHLFHDQWFEFHGLGIFHVSMR